jgi:hypothetical protein
MARYVLCAVPDAFEMLVLLGLTSNLEAKILARRVDRK